MNRFVALLSIITVITTAWSAAWFVTANFIERGIAAQADNSPRVLCEETNTTGFPFRFDVTCTAFSLYSNDITITLPELKLTALVYRPTHLLGFAQSPAEITDAFSGSQNRIDWSALTASARTQWFKPVRFSVTGQNISLTDNLIGDTLLGSAAKLEAHLLDAKGGPAEGRMHADFLLSLFEAKIPAIQTENIEGKVQALIKELPDDIRLWARPDMLNIWQRAGGSAQISQFQISAPNVSVDITGVMSVNQNGLPNGSLALESQGLAERMTDVLPPPYDSLLLGTQQADGSHSQSLSISSGVVSVGLIPLARLAPLF